jgi:ribosomal protein S18 acetylase RimI-like enzyme
MGPPPVIAPARPQGLEDAFRLIFQGVPDVERETRVANALHMVHRGELDPAGILVATDGGTAVGALACLPVPGASGLLWPPQAVGGPEQVAVEDALVRRAGAWLRERGAKLGQCLLSADEVPLADPLLRNGFAHVTALWYMQYDLSSSLPPLPRAGLLCYVPYSQLSSPATFHDTLARTYEGTEDCPEITGVRTIEEVIEGHRAQGKHDPGQWWLALAEGRPVGVLLLCEVPEWAAWDVAYVGVVPEARGRGYGRELMHLAVDEARAAGVPRLTLSVDVRNRPAWEMYRGLGFEPHDRREVFLAIWR